jgi:hypothetical protein
VHDRVGGLGRGERAVDPRREQGERRGRKLQPRRQDRSKVRSRRVQDPDPVGEGFDGPRYVATPGEVSDPERRRAAAQAVRRSGDEVLRREGRSQEGAVRRWPCRVVAAALSLRQRRVRPADPPRAREQRGQTGSDRQYLRGPTLRSRELQERHDPDEHRREENGQAEVRRVLRGALRSHGREESGLGRYRVRMGCIDLRSVSWSHARLSRLRHARRRRASGSERQTERL